MRIDVFVGLPNNICICSYISVVGGSGSGQGASAEYEIFDKRRMSPPGNLTKGNDLEKVGETTERRTRRILEEHQVEEEIARPLETTCYAAAQ